jgi:hypothetical protein
MYMYTLRGFVQVYCIILRFLWAQYMSTYPNVHCSKSTCIVFLYMYIVQMYMYTLRVFVQLYCIILSFLWAHYMSTYTSRILLKVDSN